MAVKMAIQIQTRFAAFLTLLRFTLDGGIAEISPNAQVSDGSPLSVPVHRFFMIFVPGGAWRKSNLFS